MFGCNVTLNKYVILWLYKKTTQQKMFAACGAELQR